MKAIKKTAVILALVLSFVMCLTLGASAETLAEFDYEGISYRAYSMGTEVGIAVTDADAALSGVVTIPEKFDDLEVKKISSGAFSGCTAITELVIPSTVYEIEDSALKNCTALEKVTIGSGVNKIGENIFSGCTSLDTITVSEGNTTYSTGTDGALYKADGTVLVYCPSYVAGESYSVAEGVTTVKSGAFCDCSELKAITLASTVNDIEAGAFAGSGLYNDQTNWENDALYIGGYLIEVNSDESSFVIKEGTTKIAGKAFASSKVKTLIFPESMTVLDTAEAFYESEIEAVYIPATVEKIEKLALGASYDVDVYFEGTSEQWQSLAGESLIATNVYFNHPEAAHSFTSYKPDGNATILLDGTKTAYCDYGCGEKVTVADEGSMLDFGIPKNVTSVTTTSSITLKWDAVEGATGYRIYYKTATGWAKSATITSTSHTYNKLKPASKYTFAIRPYNLDGDTVTWAPYATYEASTQAVAPAKITATYNASTIKLSWTVCPGATGYRIYYKHPVDTVWKVGLSTTNKTTHTFSNLRAGSKFDFAIRPYVQTANAVIWSGYTTYTAATTPATPYFIVKSPSAGKITVTWNTVVGAEGYRLYYKSGNGAYKLYGVYDSAKTLTFDNLKGGSKFTFAVRAGIRTSGGVVWSGYQEKGVTVAYRIQRYLNAIKGGKYYIEIHDGEGYYDGVALKNGSFCVRMNYDGEVYRIVYNRDNKKVYDIYDTGKQYMVINDDGTFAAMVSGLSGIDVSTKIVKSTTEKIGSKTYFVETAAPDADGIQSKYYFDGATLVMEKVTYEGVSVVYYYSQFTTNVPDSLFTIPSNYTKVTA